MSVISAILTKDFIVVSSDSILTFEVNGKKLIEDNSYTLPKFVSYPKLKCIISYWGLAFIKANNIKVWQTYDWLKSQIDLQEKFANVEEFGNHLKNELKKIFSKYHLRNPLEYGIGMHLTCFETFNNIQVPEVFLLSNFKSIDYNAVGDLDLSRRTIFDLYNGRVPSISLEDQRAIYANILDQAGFSFYNNGDPIMFNLFANTYHQSIQLAKQRGKLKGSLNKEFFKKLCSEPISQVSRFQKEYYIEGSIIVGGKTHTIVLNKDGSIE